MRLMAPSLPLPPEAAPDAEVDLRYLEVLADQVRRVSVAVFCVLIVMAVIAGPALPIWATAGWFTAAVAIMLARPYWLSLLPRRSDLPLSLRVRIATILAGANGAVHGASLFAFPWLGAVSYTHLTLPTKRIV